MEIKKLISPLQSWLLSTGRCVGCGMPLGRGKKELNEGQEKITCKCGRIFIFDLQSQKYRRALLEEAGK